MIIILISIQSQVMEDHYDSFCNNFVYIAVMLNTLIGRFVTNQWIHTSRVYLCIIFFAKLYINIIIYAQSKYC